MRTLYLECNAGASGDMILGALADLLPDPAEARELLLSAGIPDVDIIVERGEKSHIGGTRVRVMAAGHEEGVDDHHPHSHHRSFSEVLSVIDSLDVSDRAKAEAKAIYTDIAEAESAVHGQPVSEIHFHEVGMLDAIADIVGACMLIEKLSPDRIFSSPLRTGYGSVSSAHGMLPIPAPATAILLKGMDSYAGDIEGEFTTPTGAAIIRHFSQGFGQRPRMRIGDIGVGIGHHDFEIPNILRAFIGDTEDGMFEIYELNCNIDDMTPEDLGHVMDILLDEGALDVTISPQIMKKGRPGQRLTCLCRQDDKERLARSILENTSTIGLRMWRAERFEMTSHTEVCHTEYGDVRVKVSEGYGIRKWKAEHDDLVRIAEEKGIPVSKVRESIRFVQDRRRSVLELPVDELDLDPVPIRERVVSQALGLSVPEFGLVLLAVGIGYDSLPVIHVLSELALVLYAAGLGVDPVALEHVVDELADVLVPAGACVNALAVEHPVPELPFVFGTGRERVDALSVEAVEFDLSGVHVAVGHVDLLDLPHSFTCVQVSSTRLIKMPCPFGCTLYR